MFPFPISHFSQPFPDPVVTFIESDLIDATQSVFNYTVTNFGGIEPAANRLVVVAYWGRIATGITAITIAGVSATLETSGLHSTGLGFSGLAFAVVPTGTTSFSVSVNYAGSAQGAAISTYVVSDVGNTTPRASSTTSSGTNTITTTADNAVVIASMYHGSTGAVTWGGTLGIVEDVEVVIFTDTRASSASVDLAIAQVSKTITTTPTDRLLQHHIEFN